MGEKEVLEEVIMNTEEKDQEKQQAETNPEMEDQEVRKKQQVKETEAPMEEEPRVQRNLNDELGSMEVYNDLIKKINDQDLDISCGTFPTKSTRIKGEKNVLQEKNVPQKKKKKKKKK